jgi:DNA-binding NtrC family response regulator
MSRKRYPVERWVARSSVPVFIIEAGNSLAYFNEGCEKLTGWTAGEVLGKVCHFASTAITSSVEAVTNNLCPPPEVWAGQEVQLPVYFTPKHGASTPRLIHFFPLRASKDKDRDKVVAVMGVVVLVRTPGPPAPVSPVLQLHAELAALRSTLRTRFGEETLVTRSPAMVKVLNQVELAITSPVHVSLIGEPGTGKEHLARLIHYAGPKKDGWFVPLDCAKLDSSELERVLGRLIEVQISGVAPGVRPQPATVYLASIERLPRDLQEKLVAALKVTHKGERSGLRILSSGPRSFTDAVAGGTLRDDLESLLGTLTIHLPPLRDRQADLQLLAQHFLGEQNRQHEKQLSGFAPDIWPSFQRHAWPGNLDELQRVIQEAHAVAADKQLKLSDLPFRFRTALEAQDSPPPLTPSHVPLDEMLLRVETNAIQLALERGKFNKSKAAEILGINRARLYRRMEQLGIEDPEEGERPA